MKRSFQTKSDMVYHRVREDIVSGVFAPGERLLISAVAKQYGVSEIPVREAFQVLTQEGFLKTRPNSGFVVSQVSRQDVENIFQVRLELEALATRQAVRRMTDADVDVLENLVVRMEQYIESQDYHAYWLDNRVWHFELYKHCGNDVLIRLLTEMFDYSRRYPAYYTRQEELRNSVDEHYQIVDALRKRNAELAEAYIRSHTIETKYHYIRRVEEMIAQSAQTQGGEHED